MLSSKTHGVIDYLSGILFIASPWLFDFAEIESAKWIMLLAGVFILLMSLMTDYEYGAVRKIALGTHLTIDIITGLFLIASPWLFGFSDQIIWPFVVFGAMEVLLGIITNRRPVIDDTRHDTHRAKV